MNRGTIESNQIKIFLQPAKVRERSGGGFCISKTTKGTLEYYKVHYLFFLTKLIPELTVKIDGFENMEDIDRTTFDSLKGQAKRNFLQSKSEWSEYDSYEISILGLK